MSGLLKAPSLSALTASTASPRSDDHMSWDPQLGRLRGLSSLLRRKIPTKRRVDRQVPAIYEDPAVEAAGAEWLDLIYLEQPRSNGHPLADEKGHRPVDVKRSPPSCGTSSGRQDEPLFISEVLPPAQWPSLATCLPMLCDFIPPGTSTMAALVHISACHDPSRSSGDHISNLR